MFIRKKNKLFLKKNFLKKNFTEKNIHRNLYKIKEIDKFYSNKFLKKMLTFPYSFKIILNLNFFFKILFNLILHKITKNKKFYNKAQSIILKQNIKESHKMYDDPNYLKH